MPEQNSRLDEILSATTRRGSGPPVLFLHNGFDSVSTWDSILPFFEERFTCISWDRDGYGKRARAEGPPPAGSLEDGISELEILTRHLDLGPVHLVGHCMGGAIALLCAIRYPQRVGRLVLEAVGTHTDRRILTRVDLMRMPWGELSPEFRSRMQAMHGVTGAPATWAHIVDHRASYIMNDAYDIRPLLPALSAPCLLIAGDRDFFFTPAHASEAAEKIPGATLWRLEDNGHDVHVEIPERFALRAAAFLDL
jgi:pimeloyl-ACP methyl ester carboxylesterase